MNLLCRSALIFVVLTLSLMVSISSALAQSPELTSADRLLNQGKTEQAEGMYRQIVEKARQEKQPLEEARALEGLAAVQAILGQLREARTTQLQSSALKRKHATTSPTADSEELLQDGGFEGGLQPPWGTGHYESGNFNFGIWWNSSTCQSYAKTDSDIRHNGRNSLRITNLTPPGHHLFGTTSQRVRGIKPNTNYEISVWVKAENLKPGAVQFIMDAGWHNRPLALPGGSYDWKPLKAQFNSGELNFFDVRILTLSTGTVWLDDLSLRELSDEETPTDAKLTAETLLRKGRLRQALAAYEELPENRQTKIKKAQVLDAMGRFGEALELYREVESPPPDVGLAMGNIYLKLGQPQTAGEKFAQVYRERTEDQFARAMAADRLAAAYTRIGNLKEAIAWQGEALTIMAHINDPHGRAESLYHLARIYHAAKQSDTALRRLQEAIPLAQSTGDRTLESDILTLRAILAEENEHPEDALSDIEAAVNLKREVYDRFGLLGSLYWQGLFLEKQGSDRKAISALEEAADILEDIKHASLTIGGSDDSLLQDHARLYEALVRLYLKTGKQEEALQALSRARSAELNRVFKEKATSLKTDDRKVVEKATAMLAETNHLEEQLKEQLSAPENVRDPLAAQETLEEQEARRREYRGFLSSLFDEHPELAGLLSVNPKQLRAKQQVLQEGEAILEFLCGQNQLYLFLVSKENLEVRIVDISREELEERVKDLHETLHKEMLGTASSALVRRQSHELYLRLIKPVEEHLSGVETLCILPNGPIHYLPFQLLVSNEETGRYLVDDMACLNMCEESFLSPPSEGGLLSKILLLANPDGSLLNAEGEAESIASIFPGSKIYLGSQASKDKLIGAQKKYQGLHIATHGIFDETDASNSYLVLASEGSKEESRLTVGEVWGMDLEGFDLVTLSACLTGWGEERPGDDLVSLGNAFLYAGARSVIASLWTVDDKSTKLLMDQFYLQLREGKSHSEALRAAQISVREKYAEPYYWAPFIVVGPN